MLAARDRSWHVGLFPSDHGGGGAHNRSSGAGVIARLQADGYVLGNRIVIEGVSRGALVAGLIAAHDHSIAGVVLISGLYDLPEFAAKAKSTEAKLVVSAMMAETGGGDDALRARSVLDFARGIPAAALILNGAKDDRTDPAQARRLADEISAGGGKARVIIYPDYGHQIPVAVRDREIDPFIDRLLLVP
jgi:dipeptidyl aminopeptidase/acylaminoacyl peptidase